MEKKKKIVEISNISKYFGGVHALEGVNADIYEGEIVAIIGPNGSGKTTLLNVITGVYIPESGSVKLDGTDIQTLTQDRRCSAGIARTFQNVRLWRSRSVLDNAMVGCNHRYRHGFFSVIFHTPSWKKEEQAFRQEALSWLEFVGLQGMEDMRAENLPYAKQRFLEIARALCAKPKVLLLDEPAAGMSGVEIEHLDALLNRIRTLGITVIMIEHIMELVRGVTDRVYVLNNGKNIAEGTFEQIEQNPLVREAYLGKAGAKHA